MANNVQESNIESKESKESSKESKIARYEVWNFMSIEHAVVEFDGSNIINFKGYNDSGKSNMLRALEVCLLNKYPTQQAKFIKDDMDYFRILVTFTDGVSILKDKYASGKGLYEMYKGQDLIYTTKTNGVLTKITGVPEEIANYLGMVSYDDLHLNARNCYDRQLLVETKGKENYDFLNSVLRSEELSIAGVMLNNDKNSLLSEKNRYENEYEVYAEAYNIMPLVSQATIQALESRDKKLETTLEQESSLASLLGNIQNRENIPEIPYLQGVELTKLEDITQISVLQGNLENIPDVPLVQGVSMERLNMIGEIINSARELTELDKTMLTGTLQDVSLEQLSLLETLKGYCEDLSRIDRSEEEADLEMNNLQKEIQELKQKDNEDRIIVCKKCGTVMTLSELETHTD